MTGEEMERAIEFLIEQQAKFSTDIHELKAAQATTTAYIQSLAETQEKREQSLIISIQSLAETQEKREQSLSASIQLLAETQEKHAQSLAKTQEETAGSIRVLTETVVDLAESVSRLETRVEEMSETVQSITEEMRDGFNKLIVANEITRDLAEKAAQLAINTSHRVTNIENKLQ